MIIGIDARLYGVESGTGIGRYTEELLRELAQLPNTPPPRSPPPNGMGAKGLAFVVFLKKNDYEAFTPPDERWSKVLADFRPYTVGVQTAFPRLIRASGVDLMHFTHFDHPIRCPVPFVVTIHDLILRHHPSIRASTLDPLRFWAKYAAYRAVLHHGVTRSVRICTPSVAIEEQLHRELSVAREKVIMTPLGVDHTNRVDGGWWMVDGAENRKPSTVNRQRSTPYLLYVGNAYPHKQLDWLTAQWPAITARHPNLRLVIVGREDDFSRRLRRAVVDRTHIVFSGAIPEAELHAVIRSAAAYVTPSMDEGFDLPALEAAALGTPVIASDIAVHREVLGEAAAFFQVRDAASLAVAIHRVLVDNRFRATLIDRGIVQAGRFTWRACAIQTMSAYHETACLVAPRGGHEHGGVTRGVMGSRPPTSSQTSTRG